ncbi:nuclease-VHS inhibit celluar gene expression [Heliothis virescens ascovirus 3j]|uniref:Nuclease-VHS inhibit celluar gene expression n=1 Tax=Heliothis virescens ascovirus 3j TaxID=1561067 RepID=A0A2Z5UZF8_9VIRU|nr:nuclease-VHS inhibit celluar gene expression [Heliothis virescens ascovirus 3j]
MGIKGLSTFIAKHYSECVEVKPLSELQGKTVAFDLPCLAYRFWYGFLSNKRYNDTGGGGEKHHQRNDVRMQHVGNGLASFVKTMHRNGIRAIYVAEGMAPERKRDTILRRNASSNRSNVRSNDVIVVQMETPCDYESIDAWQTIQRRGTACDESKQQDVPAVHTTVNNRVNFNHVHACLHRLGESVVNGPSEAETTCAALMYTRMVDAVYSRDYDMLAYTGVDRVLYSISLPRCTYTCVDVDKLLKLMKLSREQFIDFCILCGTDYNKSVPGMHPKRALQLIKECLNLEGVISTHKLEQYIDKKTYDWIRNLFSNRNAHALVKGIPWSVL